MTYDEILDILDDDDIGALRGHYFTRYPDACEDSFESWCEEDAEGHVAELIELTLED